MGDRRQQAPMRHSSISVSQDLPGHRKSANPPKTSQGEVGFGLPDRAAHRPPAAPIGPVFPTRDQAAIRWPSRTPPSQSPEDPDRHDDARPGRPSPRDARHHQELRRRPRPRRGHAQGGRGRGPRGLRRERRGQEHPDEDPRRGHHRLRWRDPPRRPARPKFNGPRDAEDAGIRIIYQELNLVPELSVTANLFLGREKTRAVRPGSTSRGDGPDAADARFSSGLGTPISPRSRVADLRIGDQQMVEIAKALAFDASIVIMDEPTSALSDAEVAPPLPGDRTTSRPSGAAILYISHKMNEVFNAVRRRHRPPRRQGSSPRHPRAQTQPGAGGPLDGRPGDLRAALRRTASRIGKRIALQVEGLGLPSPPRERSTRRLKRPQLPRRGRRGGRRSPACSARAGPSCSKALFGACPTRLPRGTIVLDGSARRGSREPESRRSSRRASPWSPRTASRSASSPR